MAPPGNDERGPSGMGTASSVVQAGEAKSSLAYETPVVIDGAPAVVVFDAARSRAEDISRRLLGATRGEREAYLEGRTDGFVDGKRVGYEQGRQAERDEIDALHRAAHRVVAAMVRLPERNRRDEEWLSSARPHEDLRDAFGSDVVEDFHDVPGKDIVTRSSGREDLGGDR